MTTLQLDYIAERGYVRFIVTAAPAGHTIFRVAPNNVLETVYGYTTDAWHQTSGTGLGQDYRPPLGETVRYVIAPVGSVNLPTNPVAIASVVVPGNQAWLRDVAQPALSWPVWVVNTGTENEPVRQFVYEVSGRRLPLVVHDVRLGRRGSVQLFVPSSDDRRAIEVLLASGRPLLLNICSEKLWLACMMAVGNAAFTRFGKGPMWTLDLDYIEVDTPTVDSPIPDTSPLWQDVMDGNPSEAGDPDPVTWQWVYDNFNNWLAVATGDRN